jgi:hypothetical protein
MAQQNIYSIQLLNDLHNHFPDILYSPQRFHNVQDLLTYVIGVANTSPYRAGQLAYSNRSGNAATRPTNNRVRPTANVYPPAGPVPPILPLNIPIPPPLPRAAAAATTVRDNHLDGRAVYMTTIIDEADMGGAPVGGAGGAAAAAHAQNVNPLVNTILGSLFGDILGGQGQGINLNAFLDTRVPVYPSLDNINNATTVYRANRRQDDICAICQDEIESNQEMRRVNHCGHYFHRNCIDTWFQGNVHCPTCRHDIRQSAAAAREEDNQNNIQTTASDAAGGQQQTPHTPPPVPDNYRRMNIRRQN